MASQDVSTNDVCGLVTISRPSRENARSGHRLAGSILTTVPENSSWLDADVAPHSEATAIRKPVSRERENRILGLLPYVIVRT